VRVPLLAGRASVVAGADYYHWDYRLSLSDSKQNIGTPFNKVKADQDNTAGYVQLEARVTDTTTVTAGARYEQQHIDASDAYNPSAPGGAFGSGAPTGEQTKDETAWELALRQELDRSWAAFARAGRAFRFATVDEIYEFSPSFQREFQFLQPQTSIGYDLGLEYRTPTLTGRATIFQLDVDNEIFLDPFRTGIGNTNLPPTRRRGFELEARWMPTSTLALTGTYTYTNAEFREGTVDAYGQAFDISGNRVPLVPLQHVSGQAAWAFAPKWQLSGTVLFVSSQYMENDQPNTGTKIPSYATADVRLDYSTGPWRFSGAVANVFDEEYYDYAVRSATSAVRYNAYPLPPRTFWAAVEYRFR
jgi:iron complex outermembrane receptor protein